MFKCPFVKALGAFYKYKKYEPEQSRIERIPCCVKSIKMMMSFINRPLSRHFQHEKGPMAFSGHCKFREGSFTALQLSVCSVYCMMNDADTSQCYYVTITPDN